jgi:hypothetical protein
MIESSKKRTATIVPSMQMLPPPPPVQHVSNRIDNATLAIHVPLNV